MHRCHKAGERITTGLNLFSLGVHRMVKKVFGRIPNSFQSIWPEQNTCRLTRAVRPHWTKNAVLVLNEYWTNLTLLLVCCPVNSKMKLLVWLDFLYSCFLLTVYAHWRWLPNIVKHALFGQWNTLLIDRSGIVKIGRYSAGNECEASILCSPSSPFGVTKYRSPFLSVEFLSFQVRSCPCGYCQC